MSFFGCLVVLIEKAVEYLFFKYVWPSLEKFLKRLIRKGIGLLVIHIGPRLFKMLQVMLKACVGIQDIQIA
jgi:hypothetical protein